MNMKIEDIDVLDRINAMRSLEEKTARSKNYLTSLVDAPCRKAMIDWCFVICDSFDLSRETVWIAMSILDRYLSTGKGKSGEALQTKQKYQLSVITSFYIAVKTNEPFQLGIDMLVKLCRGYYKESTIFAMEREILASLEWRVCASATTPMEFVRHFLALLPEWKDATDVIIENAMKHLDCATEDIYFSTCRVSAVGVACLAGALDDTYVLSPLEKDMLWRQLSNKLDFDIASNEIRKVESHLLAKSTPPCEPKRRSRASLSRRSVNATGGQPSSPVSVLVV